MERLDRGSEKLLGLFSLGPILGAGVLAGLLAGVASAAARRTAGSWNPGWIEIEFVLFGATILGVALFHRVSAEIATAGLVSLLVDRLLASGLEAIRALRSDWALFLNLAGLLLGFAILAKQFEESNLPELLLRWIPASRAGGFALLVLVWAISSFLDNIAAAMLGGVMARKAFGERVPVGYLAAIVAASNAGGAWSVVGDTTTTLVWIGGVSPAHLVRALVGSATAIAVVGAFASFRPERERPMGRDRLEPVGLDKVRLFLVGSTLAGAIAANAAIGAPALGVWAAILLGALLRPVPWKELPAMLKGTGFLLCLVAMARLMPLRSLPAASWESTLGLGLLSAVFDNIPLTALALFQGGYDWALLAYAVGFGGSMIWFGSSAGVALSSLFPESRNTLAWLREGWPVILAYFLGFAVLLLAGGWKPTPVPVGSI